MNNVPLSWRNTGIGYPWVRNVFMGGQHGFWKTVGLQEFDEFPLFSVILIPKSKNVLYQYANAWKTTDKSFIKKYCTSGDLSTAALMEKILPPGLYGKKLVRVRRKIARNIFMADPNYQVSTQGSNPQITIGKPSASGNLTINQLI